jgi:thiol-disulfide isomerase/thioredoxin
MRLAGITVVIIFFSLLVGYTHEKILQAPAFTLLNNNDIIVNRSNFKGNLIISFFASYCKPCKQEVPALVELENKYGIDKKLDLVLIAIDLNDQEGEAKDKVNKFLTQLGIKHEFLLDIYQIVISKYNSEKIVPSTFLVNRHGQIVFCATGMQDDTISRLEQAIIALKY